MSYRKNYTLTALFLCVALAPMPATAWDLQGITRSYMRQSLGPRPGRWCGFQMRQWFGGGRDLNLARNWARVGRPTSPGIGAIVVWPRHVGYITGRAGKGMWVVKSGNDGGRVRERPRSIAGAIAFRRL